MPREWIDVTIATELDAGELISRLDDPFVQGAWQDGGLVHLYWPRARWSADQLTRLRETLRRLDAEREFPAIEVEQVPDRDWNRLWVESVKPLCVGRRLVIRPSWESVVLQPNEVEIILDPKQAFGTGHHATTRLLLEWLEETIGGGESILDVGTGSGLLAVAALKLGASRAVGTDRDPVAIECATENARLNGCGSALTLSTQPLTELLDQRFDVVVANLDLQTLLQLADRLAGCTGIRLLVSGLLLDQREELVAGFARTGLYPGQQRERDGWLALEFLPSESCEGSLA